MICAKKNNAKNPVIKICECEKFYHVNCLKKSVEKMIEKKEDIGIIIFEIKTVCDKCSKFIPFNFIVKKGGSYKYLELIDIPRNLNENYLILETLDFQKVNDKNVKYIYFIKLTKKDIENNHEDILIIKDPIKNEEIMFYNKIEKERLELKRIKKETKEEINLNPPNILAAIVYDMVKKSLFLRCMDDNRNILVLGDKYIIKPDHKLILQSKYINMESYIIKHDQFAETQKEMENNPDKIEERKNYEEV